MQNTNETNTIHPGALKAARKRQGISQQQLADALKCTKDTVSRWERGAVRRVRPHLRKRLRDTLHVSWEKLTTPPEQTDSKGEEIHGHKWIKWAARTETRTALQLVALRFNVKMNEVLELAPLLFLIAAERSLLERRRKLKEIYATYDEMEEKVGRNAAHLGGILVARSTSADDQLDKEENSLEKRDVFGRLITYEFWTEGDEGPFVHFIRDLAKGVPEDALASIDSFDGDMIGSYQIADSTLRECTGISENDEQGEKLLDCIRQGSIDLTECRRAKRDRDEADYRQWLLEELKRVNEENQRFWKELGLPGGIKAELPASDEGNEQ